jgi:hypothetical protein
LDIDRRCSLALDRHRWKEQFFKLFHIFQTHQSRTRLPYREDWMTDKYRVFFQVYVCIECLGISLQSFGPCLSRDVSYRRETSTPIFASLPNFLLGCVEHLQNAGSSRCCERPDLTTGSRGKSGKLFKAGEFGEDGACMSVG